MYVSHLGFLLCTIRAVGCQVQGYRHKVDAMEFRAQAPPISGWPGAAYSSSACMESAWKCVDEEQAAVRIQAIMKGSVQRLRLGKARKS